VIYPRCVWCIQVRSKDSQVKTQVVLWIFILFKVTRWQHVSASYQGDNMFRPLSPGHKLLIANYTKQIIFCLIHDVHLGFLLNRNVITLLLFLLQPDLLSLGLVNVLISSEITNWKSPNMFHYETQPFFKSIIN
jgi:hypothetical protein